MLSSSVVLFEQVRHIRVEINKVEELHRVVVIVLRIKIALNNDIWLEFSHFCCRYWSGRWTLRFARKKNLMMWVNLLKQFSWKWSSSHHHGARSVGYVCEKGLRNVFVAIRRWMDHSISQSYAGAKGGVSRIESQASSIFARAAIYAYAHCCHMGLSHTSSLSHHC